MITVGAFRPDPTCYDIALIEDDESEGIETFEVFLTTTGPNDIILQNKSTVIITDNDGNIFFLFSTNSL